MGELDQIFRNVSHIIDSEIAKAMLSKNSYAFNTLLANQLREIHSNTKRYGTGCLASLILLIG